MKLVKRLFNAEKGAALMLVLALLIIGSLIIPPELLIIQNGFTIGKALESGTEKLYCADAGIEQAVAWLQSHDPMYYPVDTRRDNETVAPFTAHPVDAVYFPMTEIDGYNVIAAMAYAGTDSRGSNTYEVISLAGSDIEWPGAFMTWDGVQGVGQIGSFTKVKSFILDTTGNFTDICNHVVTTPGEYDPRGTSITDPIFPSQAYPLNQHGVYEEYPGAWPTVDQMRRFYMSLLGDVTPYGSSSLNLVGNRTIDGLVRNGTLAVSCSSNGAPTLEMNGNIYITGDADFGISGKPFNLNMNGHTIFVESPNSGGQYALEIGNKVMLQGSGCVIAVGNIDFGPRVQSNPNNYILVMSLIGMTSMHPETSDGKFYGTVAGFVEVESLNTRLKWVTPITSGISFPGFINGLFWGIAAYRIETVN